MIVLNCWTTTGVLRSEQTIHTFSPDSPDIRTDARHLLLSSKLLNEITSHILHSRAVFDIRNEGDLKRFVTTASETTLGQMKHVSIRLYDDDGDSPSPESDSEIRVMAGFNLLSKLPSELRSLRFSPPHDMPFYVASFSSNPLLIEQLKRFSSLQDLDLNFHDSWLNLDLISSAGYRPNIFWNLKDNALLPSMFPLLRRLRFEGCINDITGPEDLRRALSQDQLPSLQTLIVDSLLYQGVRAGRSVFTPEVISGMKPLVEFTWICYNFGEKPRRTMGWQDGPLGRPHLEALSERHGKTLRRLSINYTGCRSERDVRYIPDKQGFERLLEGFDDLKNVSIISPPIIIEISK